MSGTSSGGFVDRLHNSEAIISRFGRALVLILSLALIVFISYDTFKGINFLENHLYMEFQFWVCIVFLLDFFIQLIMAKSRKSYLLHRWFFLFISIPYLNIINLFHIQFSPEALYYIRFIPLIRGAYTFTLVAGYFSTNRAFSLLTQYALLLLSVIYFTSLIFFYEEKNVNSNVTSYWDALYWACMDCSTVGSYINAVTVVGKILSVILPVLGMMVLPLFTVFVTSKVKEYNDRQSARDSRFLKEWHEDFSHSSKADATSSDSTTGAPGEMKNGKSTVKEE